MIRSLELRILGALRLLFILAAAMLCSLGLLILASALFLFVMSGDSTFEGVDLASMLVMGIALVTSSLVVALVVVLVTRRI